MGWMKRYPYDEFFGDGYEPCTCSFSPFSPEVDVDRVSFELINENLYILVKLTDGNEVPVKLSKEEIERLKELIGRVKS